jgi:hypothetical protein
MNLKLIDRLRLRSIIQSQDPTKLCWIDRLRSTLPGKHPPHSLVLGSDPVVSAIMLGLLITLIGVAPLIISRQWNLILSLPVILTMTGIIWSILFYLIGSQNYADYLALYETALDSAEGATYQKLKSVHLKSIGNDFNHFVVSALIWLVGVIVAWADMYRVLPDNFPRPLQVLGPEWMSSDLRPYRLATIYIFGFIVTLLVWTLGRQIILHTLFLVRINYLKCVPSAHLYFLRFRPLLRINILGAFGWAVGVAHFGLLFRTSFGTLQIAFLGLLGMVAAVALFWPTLLFQEKLREIGMVRINTLVDAAKEKLALTSTDPARWSDLFLIEEQMAKQATDLSLAVGLRYLGYLLTAFVIPVLIAIISTLVTKYLETGTK